MRKIKMSEVTEDQLSALSNEAAQAGDKQTVQDCLDAVPYIRGGGKGGQGLRAAKRVLRVLNKAREADTDRNTGGPEPFDPIQSILENRAGF